MIPNIVCMNDLQKDSHLCDADYRTLRGRQRVGGGSPCWIKVLGLGLELINLAPISPYTPHPLSSGTPASTTYKSLSKNRGNLTRSLNVSMHHPYESLSIAGGSDA